MTSRRRMCRYSGLMVRFIMIDVGDGDGVVVGTCRDGEREDGVEEWKLSSTCGYLALTDLN
jgi:hypothetical protein